MSSCFNDYGSSFVLFQSEKRPQKYMSVQYAVTDILGTVLSSRSETWGEVKLT
jgi:hypothetical protein